MCRIDLNYFTQQMDQNPGYLKKIPIKYAYESIWQDYYN